MARIRQQRIASREQLRAVLHVLSLCEIAVQEPQSTLDAVNPLENERRDCYDGRPFITNLSTGQLHWADVSAEDDYNRIILSPDEGGPLYTAWQFCAMRNLPIGFNRDELQLGKSKVEHSQFLFCAILD